MYTPLKKTALHDLLNKPILFDANIFMVGISERTSDKNYSFENIKRLYIKPLFESFTDIYIHEEVYKELDEESRNFVDSYIGKNITIVKEDGLYGKDPKYTTIFNNISKHELVNYERGRSKDRGEVYSLAYAAYYNINYIKGDIKTKISPFFKQDFKKEVYIVNNRYINYNVESGEEVGK